MFLLNQLKYFITRFLTIAVIIFLITMTVFVYLSYQNQINYLDDLMDYYDSTTYDNIGIVNNVPLKEDMYRYFGDDRIHFFKNVTQDGLVRTNGFSGIVIQQYISIEYTNMSVYAQDSIYLGEYRTLAPDEVVISKDIADRSNLWLGDKVYLIVNNQTIQLKVTAILKNTNNIVTLDTSTKQGTILLNSHIDLSEKPSQIMHFFNRSTALNSYSENIIIVDNVIRKLKQDKQEIMLEIAILIIAIEIIGFYIIYKSIQTNIRAYVLVISPWKKNIFAIIDYLSVAVLYIGGFYWVNHIYGITSGSINVLIIVITILTIVVFYLTQIVDEIIRGIDIWTT